MSVKYDKVTRRQFLIGTGGYFLVIPFLPSLLSREALAQASPFPHRMLLTTVDHCMMASQNINPALATTAIAPGIREVLLSSLNQPLATYLTHPLYNTLKTSGLITMVRGLDNAVTPFGHGPTWFTGSVNSSYDGIYSPSIDAYMETSQTLYPPATSTGYLKKILRCNESYSYKKVGDQVTKITDCYADNQDNGWNGCLSLYNAMMGRFSGGSTPPPTPPSTDNSRKNNILTHVFSAYQNARNNRRISSDDKQRLDDHMERIHELQLSLGTGGPVVIPQASCENPINNSALVNNTKFSYTDRMEVYLKLIYVALTCGMTKVALLNFEGHSSYDINPNKARFPSHPGHHFHNTILHNELGAYSVSQIESNYTYWMKWQMDKLANYVLAPLHATEDTEANNGKSFLENMIVGLLSEGGVHADPGAHANLDYMPILFGNMNGRIKSNRLVVFDRGAEGAGLPYNTFLITLLRAMGLSENEYSAGSNMGRGFGAYPTSGKYYQKWFSRYYQPITEIWNG